MEISQNPTADKPARPRRGRSDRAMTPLDPVEIKFWKTRRRDIAIHVTQSIYEGVNVFGVREHAVGSDGISRPTQRGITMSVRRLQELADAVNKILRIVKERGLIPDSEGGDAS
jgi:hypothetical protein